MKEHADFANGTNSPRKLSTEPEFKVIKPGVKTKRTVLVLDKSGSMGSDSRIEVLGQVCTLLCDPPVTLKLPSQTHSLNDTISINLCRFDWSNT